MLEPDLFLEVLDPDPLLGTEALAFELDRTFDSGRRDSSSFAKAGFFEVNRRKTEESPMSETLDLMLWIELWTIGFGL